MGIYFPYIRVSTHGHVQNIGQIPQKPFLDISSCWNIYKGNILQKLQENSIMSHMTYLMILQSLIPWLSRKYHQTLSKPFLSFSKFEQLCTAKHVKMLSNLGHMLKWCKNASRPNGTSWREEYHDQSVLKPFLSRNKFEQLYIAKCVLLIWIFVDMFKSSNDDTTPSGASRRIDLHD